MICFTKSNIFKIELVTRAGRDWAFVAWFLQASGGNFFLVIGAFVMEIARAGH